MRAGGAKWGEEWGCRVGCDVGCRAACRATRVWNGCRGCRRWCLSPPLSPLSLCCLREPTLLLWVVLHVGL